MCGIAGYIGTEQIDEGRIRQTLGLMVRRGPDHQDWAAMRAQEMNIILLHSRLSIIDLDERSNQPFTILPYPPMGASSSPPQTHG